MSNFDKKNTGKIIIPTIKDKESLYELQKIDCNCNDYGYMKRDMNK